MKLQVIAWLATVLTVCCGSVRGDIYISGHADVGVEFDGTNLHLHLHAEDPINLFGGGTLPAGEYEPGDFMIGVPGPSEGRPAGSQWDFLASAAGAPVWFLPEDEDVTKPFLGLGTEELDAADWTSLTWTFNSISTVSGAASEFAIWRSTGTEVLASTLQPTGNSWTQLAGTHGHVNMGFTGEGIYDVNFTITGISDGSGSVAAGTFSDTASFRFVTGSVVPEPGSLALLALAASGAVVYRRRR